MCITSAKDEGTVTRDGITGIFHTSLNVHVWHKVKLLLATTYPGEMSLSSNMTMYGNRTASSHSGTSKKNRNWQRKYCASIGDVTIRWSRDFTQQQPPCWIVPPGFTDTSSVFSLLDPTFVVLCTQHASN